ncbi:MAG: flagellar biosynthesis anti-sigma factor FlgM [Sedimentisphaerales bacterium]|nr:flagellar biosynthesis anti-sigma factor FlgM [Sedimentisphaerales bacterium]
MSTAAIFSKFRPTDHRESRHARNGHPYDAPPNNDVLTGQILENRNTTSQKKALKQIASLPLTRRREVLNIRRQIADGTYKVADRLDKAMDRVLESLAT